MTPKLSKSALFESIGYAPHAGQLLVHRSTASRRVLACGVRWGKSTCAVGEVAAALLQPRRQARGWVVAPTFDLTRLVFERAAKLIQNKFSHRVKSLSVRQHSITVVNFGGGLSTLEAKSADNPSSLLGESLDFVVLDEAAKLKPEIWTEHVSQRLLDRAGWALFVSTPAGRDWYWKLYRRGQNGRDPDFESWSSPSWKNPTLSRALIDAERGRLTADAFAAQYGGQFVGPDLEPCDRCGGPSPNAPTVVILQHGEEHPRCLECRGQVDKRGRTVVHRFANGRSSVMTLRMGPDAPSTSLPPDPPRLPQSDLHTRAS